MDSEDNTSTTERREDPEVTLRCKHVRFFWAADNQAEFARMLGIPVSRWYHIEIGHPLSKQLALLLKEKAGVSLDWLFCGDGRGMTAEELDRYKLRATFGVPMRSTGNGKHRANGQDDAADSGEDVSER